MNVIPYNVINVVNNIKLFVAGHVESAGVLIREAAETEVLSRQNQDGRTPLHITAGRGRYYRTRTAGHHYTLQQDGVGTIEPGRQDTTTHYSRTG